ncbi:CoA-binding protein [uncultured Maribacter sp.]|uniref:CoA-binding protein n=1 Tax=uncultured Maribacter sp. TaxID=431308 RepID=UPI0026226A52|nr:CoA-binding protein [uncultured Maribacter sp.]
MKKTLVIGASLNSNRYSNIAIHRLVKNGTSTEAFGLKLGTVSGVQIKTKFIHFQNINTITLYLNPKRQEAYYKNIVDLRPERVIFSPGTENPVFYSILEENGIKGEVACILVLLVTNQH